MILTELDIKQKVKDLAIQIHSDYKDINELYFIYILDGAFIFAADLARELSKLGRSLVIGSLLIKTYDGTKSVIKNPIIRPSFNFSLKDKNILIIDDILDTGNTLNIIVKAIQRQKPKSINTCVLLRKNIVRKIDQEIKYVGFEIKDKFVIGYGLDLNNIYRELPYIIEYFYFDEKKYSWGKNYGIGIEKKELTLNELLDKCNKCPTVFTQQPDGSFGCDLRCKDLDDEKNEIRKDVYKPNFVGNKREHF